MTRVEVLRMGIRALASCDASALLQLAEEARTAAGPASESERADMERLQDVFHLLLVLTGRNLRLLRVLGGRVDGCAAEGY